MSEPAASVGAPMPRLTLGAMELPDEPARGAAPSLRQGGADSNGGGGGGGDDNESSANPSNLTGNASLNESIAILRMVVLNEQFTPEILPFQLETIDTLRQLVSTQTDLVDAEEDADGVDHLSFESQLRRMELERINYQLRHYYRLRIAKIQRYIMHIFKGDGPYEHLSEAEKRFAVGYSDLMEDHFKKSFLSLLPQRLQIVEKDGAVEPATPPNLNKFVFCRVRNTIGAYAIGEDATDESLDFSAGDVLCIRYKSIRDLLANEDVELL